MKRTIIFHGDYFLDFYKNLDGGVKNEDQIRF